MHLTQIKNKKKTNKNRRINRIVHGCEHWETSVCFYHYGSSVQKVRKRMLNKENERRRKENLARQSES